MEHPPLYRASVPVFLAVLDRMEGELRRAETALGRHGLTDALASRPAEGMMHAARQMATAMQFTLRIAYCLAGQRVPEPDAALDLPGLRARLVETRALLSALKPAEFSDGRVCRTAAGFAEIELPGEAFLHEFGLPNLYFHQAMAHVALKQAGVPLGKADFDGKHDYPEGFSLG